MSALPSPTTLYKALVSRDSAYDGIFYVGVRTTGIFCRPVCPARKPKPEHVEYFANRSDALHAGYRPCKRCRPMESGGSPPTWAKRLLQKVEGHPTERMTDSDVRRLGIDPERARRYFKTAYGMTFQAYQRSLRMGLALREIRSGGGIVEAAMDAGYESDSGFRDAFEAIIGSTPGRADAARAVYAKWIDTPLGGMLACADDEGLCLLEFVDRRMLQTQIETLRRRLGCAVVPGEHPVLRQIEEELAAYFKGELREFKTPLRAPGTSFQMKVWERLRAIPYGQTLSYGEMARDIGVPDAQRAVGKANGDNRLAIIIPCHRVVRADGTLCGYGGGMWRKRWLLDLERGERKLDLG
ncbi:MAG: bifunctional transcriptional activator/DNA repair protein Ada [Fimbriimonas ginsengisoli]|uniref:Methylated-DNA--protein-cysteine methyltransferase n=1 Tax=Fimbriimonas ginsengisoli TaxID=1005039 RepID=A0A931LT78_FIMGI|nr:bifunctional transcriptional activator/DNA repair protein Ada [Fimbriimonas ginsengisoli]